MPARRQACGPTHHTFQPPEPPLGLNELATTIDTCAPGPPRCRSTGKEIGSSDGKSAASSSFLFAPIEIAKRRRAVGRRGRIAPGEEGLRCLGREIPHIQKVAGLPVSREDDDGQDDTKRSFRSEKRASSPRPRWPRSRSAIPGPRAQRHRRECWLVAPSLRRRPSGPCRSWDAAPACSSRRRS